MQRQFLTDCKKSVSATSQIFAVQPKVNPRSAYDVPTYARKSIRHNEIMHKRSISSYVNRYMN